MSKRNWFFLSIMFSVLCLSNIVHAQVQKEGSMKNIFAKNAKYSNADYGIEIQYPAKWALVEDKGAGQLQLLISPEQITSTNDLGNIKDYLMTIAVTKKYTQGTAQSIIDLEIKAATSKGHIIDSPDNVNINGKIWKKYKYQINNIVTTKYVYIDITGNLTTVATEESQASAGKHAVESEKIIKSLSWLDNN